MPHTRLSTLHDSLLFRVCIIPNHPLSTIRSCSVCASYPIIHSPRFSPVPCVNHTHSSTFHDSLSFRVCIIPSHPLSMILSCSVCASYPIIHSPRFSTVPCVHHTKSSTLHDFLPFRVFIIPNHPLSTIFYRSVCASYPIIHSPRFSTVPCVHHTRHPLSTTPSPSIITVQQALYRVSLLSFSNLPLLFSSRGQIITQPTTNKSITSTTK